MRSQEYLGSRFVGLDLADLVKLLDTCPWFDEPLNDLHFFDA